MRVEFLLEEPSAEAVLSHLAPKILSAEVECGFHPFQGKPDLLKKLPSRLQGYSHWRERDLRIVILLDCDSEDCLDLKSKVERIVTDSQIFCVRYQPGTGPVKVLIRIAIEEIESWFLGDIAAVHAAYPRIPLTLEKRKGLRNPDDIKGGTWECLERILKEHGYHRGGLEKIRAAREIAACMEPSRNRSQSFHVFCEGLKRLVNR